MPTNPLNEAQTPARGFAGGFASAFDFDSVSDFVVVPSVAVSVVECVAFVLAFVEEEDAAVASGGGSVVVSVGKIDDGEDVDDGDGNGAGTGSDGEPAVWATTPFTMTKSRASGATSSGYGLRTTSSRYSHATAAVIGSKSARVHSRSNCKRSAQTMQKI